MSNSQLYLFCVLMLLTIPAAIRASYEWFWKPNHHVAKHYMAIPQSTRNPAIPKRCCPMYGNASDVPVTGSNTK